MAILGGCSSGWNDGWIMMNSHSRHFVQCLIRWIVLLKRFFFFLSNTTRFHYLPVHQLPQTVIPGTFSTKNHWHKIHQNSVDEWFNFSKPKAKLTHGSVSRHNQRLAQFLSTVNLLPAIFLFSFTVRKNLVRIIAFCMTGCWRTNTARLDRFFLLCVLPKGGRPNDTETRINIRRMVGVADILSL